MTDPYAEVRPSRRMRLTPANQIDIAPVVWAWEESGEGRIPAGSLSIAAGREGTGKSSFGLWMAAHITRGTLPGSFYGTPRRVFYVAVEDSWKYTLGPRLIAAGADRSMVYRCDVMTDEDTELTLRLPSDNSVLETAIRDYGVGLVVIDPLMSVIGESIDTHRSRDVRTALDPLAQMADRTGAVVLGIAHFNKGSGTDVSSLITGSGAFKDVPRSVFGFARDDAAEDGTRIMTQSKNSLGRDDLPSLSYRIENFEIPTGTGVANTGRFEFTGESERSVSDVLREASGVGGSAEDRDERKHAHDWIVGYLIDNGGEAPANDCLKNGVAAGYSRDALKRAKPRSVDRPC
ncbi:AAA family ATPase [Mycolicibacterium smegmatis]|uniref:AAA family ATPase n=1 Tax=Mycolicibacterium smegmatis TaxID=1772 RepID=UPI001EFA7409|nr:AAA family ATPase [Mycolicibacterium smegmatis]ULN34189.1 AAA family ATPase [Mycolicibacterium smegmatis]